MAGRLLVGTAGWSIPRASAERFAGEGTHLERYACVFAGVEINSSFHRPHAAKVYEKWALSTPPGFRFAVKLPRTITHDLTLRRVRAPLERFLDESAGLGGKRGPLLVQLPPSHAFDARVAGRFFDLVRSRYEGPLVCEPRHPTWGEESADRLLVRHHVARVAADPPTFAGGEVPRGWPGLVYYRLHGSPRKYWSRYDAEYIDDLSGLLRLASLDADAWCVFDNTAMGAAIENALELCAISRGCSAPPAA